MSVSRVVLASVSAAFLAASAAVSGPAAATTPDANVLLAQEAYKSLASGDADAAISAYDKAIESRGLAPEVLANALLNRGLAYQQINRHEAAIDDYTAALRLDAMSAKLRAVALYNRGLSQHKLSQPAQAIEDFTSALFLDSEFAHAYLGRANTLRDSGQYLFALSDYEKAIRFKHPDAARVHYGEALTFEALRRPKEARQSLERALAANPKFAPAKQRLAAIAAGTLAKPPADPIVTGSIASAGRELVARKTVLPQPIAPSPALLASNSPPKVIFASTAQRRKLITDRVPAEETAPRAEVEKVIAIEPVPDEPVTDEPVVDEAAASEPAISGWSVQLASASSEDGAWSTWKKLQNRHRALTAEKPVVIKADLGSKGIFYRVRLTGFDDQKAAKGRCSSLKTKGVSCFVSKTSS